MSHIPFGYMIVDGSAVINSIQAEKLRTLYNSYLKGKSLSDAAKSAGIECFHGQVGKMIDNTKYLGTTYYPQIIDEDTFRKAKEEREKRSKKHIRNVTVKKEEYNKVSVLFHFNTPYKEYKDPYAQAAYLYSLIESE